MTIWDMIIFMTALVYFATMIGMVIGRITLKQMGGVAFIAEVVEMIASSHILSAGVYFHATAAAVAAWLWWVNGGGDDTKRRLRKLKTTFQGVRRTAPVPA